MEAGSGEHEGTFSGDLCVKLLHRTRSLAQLAASACMQAWPLAKLPRGRRQARL